MKLCHYKRVRLCLTQISVRSETLSIVQSDTKKREILKNPTKIEEIQEKKIIDRN